MALDELNFNTEVEISPEGVVPGDRLDRHPASPARRSASIRIHSDALTELYDSDVAWIDVRWDIQRVARGRNHKVAISLMAVNQPGSLATVTAAIAELRGQHP